MEFDSRNNDLIIKGGYDIKMENKMSDVIAVGRHVDSADHQEMKPSLELALRRKDVLGDIQ